MAAPGGLAAPARSLQPRRLHREEVRELGRIYRRTASDLAIARAEIARPAPRQLPQQPRHPRARPHLPRRRRRRALARPRLLRARLPPHLPPHLALHGARLRRLHALRRARLHRPRWRDAEFSELAGVPPALREEILERKPRWWKSVNEANQIAASQIGTNNIRVTFNAFALGATLRHRHALLHGPQRR